MEETRDILAEMQENVRIEAIAEFVGLSTMRIRQLENAGIIRSFKEGRTRFYDKWPTLLALLAYYKAKADKAGDSMELEKIREETKNVKLQIAKAKRELEEMKVQRARGELLHTDDLKRIFGGMFSRLHIGLESFPLGIAPKLVGKTDVMENAEIIKKGLDKLMYEITEFNFETLKASSRDRYIAGLESEENKQQRL